ncbi:MAG: ribulose-phosphate 3-epimerase [Deltaproteobacteria bacterium]|nr:ribulose-phosphate 3-epimerase [Deltaproteobacteria bacterium]MCL5276928.1 ribulose-phosphate 3-epimerase [Deltaproteobacteria bacterium]
MRHIRIAPSLLASDFSRLAEEIKAVEMAGADMLHIDVMDGRFVPNITIGQPVVSSIRKTTKLPLDVHLMIVDPMDHIDSFIDAGADIVTVHLEACNHLHRAMATIKSAGRGAGVSLNPATPVVMLKDILEELSLVLIMTVNPGFGGQEFIRSGLDKIKELDRIRQSRNASLLIEVDGGITAQNVAGVIKAGADIVVAGTAIFGSKDYRQAIRRLKLAR